MKRILIFAQIILISIGLFGNTIVKVKFMKDKLFLMERGQAQCIEEGMEGKAQVTIKSTLDENEYPTDVGIFIVKKVNETSSELFLEKIDPNIDIDTINRVEFKPTAKEIECYIEMKSYFDAAGLVEQALKEKPGNEELKLLKTGLDLLLSDEISVKDFIEYKRIAPGVTILKDMVEKLSLSQDGKNFINAIRSVIKNNKGYDEATFNDSHVMIYAPDKNLFLDKYEVSTDQVKKVGIQIKPVKFFWISNYPSDSPGYPAIVSFEEAERYCASFGMRLPTEEEWENFAGSNTDSRFGWGDRDVDANNTYRANYESFEDRFPELSPVKSFETYPSPYGAVNMAGNVSEWVKEGGSKGGDFLSEKRDLNFSDKSTDSICVGFRCVREVK